MRTMQIAIFIISYFLSILVFIYFFVRNKNGREGRLDIAVILTLNVCNMGFVKWITTTRCNKLPGATREVIAVWGHFHATQRFASRPYLLPLLPSLCSLSLCSVCSHTLFSLLQFAFQFFLLSFFFLSENGNTCTKAATILAGD